MRRGDGRHTYHNFSYYKGVEGTGGGGRGGAVGRGGVGRGGRGEGGGGAGGRWRGGFHQNAYIPNNDSYRNDRGSNGRKRCTQEDNVYANGREEEYDEMLNNKSYISYNNSNTNKSMHNNHNSSPFYSFHQRKRVVHSHNEQNNQNLNLAFCKYFAFDGSCKFGAKCFYKHSLRRLAHVPHAHDDGIISCAVAKTKDGLVELYTASADKTLRRWAVSSSDEKGLLSICLQNTTPFSSELTSCTFFNDCLFCAQNDGLIKCFHRLSGSNRELIGHSDPVYCLLSVNNTLVSGCWGGKIRIWSYDNLSDSFKMINKIEIEGKIFCMKDVRVLQNNINEQNSQQPTEFWYLWVGGSVLQIIDLCSLQVVKTLPVNKSVVMSLVQYEGHMIAGFSCGSVKVYSLDGNETFSYDGDMLSSMDGMLGIDGPLLLYGTTKGFIRSLTLPQFEELGHIKAHEHSDVKVIVSLGAQHFLTCGKDGALSIWQWVKPE